MAETETPADDLRWAGTRMRAIAAAPEHGIPAPPLLAPLSDLLMALADEMADYPAVHVPNGIGIASKPNQPSAVWTAAHRVATTYRITKGEATQR